LRPGEEKAYPALKHFDIIGALCVFVAFFLILYRLNKKEEALLTGAGYVPVDVPDNRSTTAAARFTGCKPAGSYLFNGPHSDRYGPVYLFKHVPSGDEPQITSLVIQSNLRFDRTAVVYKVYGSHFLFRAFKKMLIKTGDLGIEGEPLAELDEYNKANFDRHGLFGMGEPGFDTGNPAFINLTGALRGMDRKAVIGLGLSGRLIVVWGVETAQVLKLWKNLLQIAFPGQEGLSA